MKIPSDIDTRALRREFGLGRDAFARRLNVPFAAVVGWETRRRASPAAVEFLKLRLPLLRKELEAEARNDAAPAAPATPEPEPEPESA